MGEMNSGVKGLWNIVLSGYPKSGKTITRTERRKVFEHSQHADLKGIEPHLLEILYGSLGIFKLRTVSVSLNLKAYSRF